MKPEDLELLQELKHDAMATFCLIGILGNPSLTYLKPDESCARAIQHAAKLQEMLDAEVTPQPAKK